MLLNAQFPTRDIGSDPAKIKDWAQAAEDLGFSHIEVADHVFGAAARGASSTLARPHPNRFGELHHHAQPLQGRLVQGAQLVVDEQGGEEDGEGEDGGGVGAGLEEGGERREREGGVR